MSKKERCRMKEYNLSHVDPSLKDLVYKACGKMGLKIDDSEGVKVSLVKGDKASIEIKPDEIKKLKIGKVLFSGETKNGVFRNFDAFAWDNISADNESIREAIKAKDESYGEITEISVLGTDKDTLKLKFSISRKIPEIFIDRSWFSKDKYIINILEESGSVETELKSDYAILIGVELVAEVVDSTPFWGDIPLLGQLFQSKSETRQIRWLLLKVSGRGQDKNGHSHE